MKLVTLISLILTLIGGLNWLLFGLMGTNLFVTIGGGGPLTMLLYVLTTVATFHIVFPVFMKHLQTA